MRADRRAQSARPQGMSLANLLREAKRGACPPLLRSYATKMKEFLWGWIFYGSLVFCGLLVASLLAAYALFSTAPLNPHTPVFAAGFGFAFGFLGLGALTLIFFDKLSRKAKFSEEPDSEIFKRVVTEMPFFFFSLVYFFSMALFMGIFLLMLSFIHNATT